MVGLYQKLDVSLTKLTWTALTSCGSDVSDERRDADVASGDGERSFLSVGQKSILDLIHGTMSDTTRQP